MTTPDSSHNPFAAPRARVDDPGPNDSGQLLSQPRRVAAGRGFGWLGEGWTLFKEAPGTWIGLTLVWVFISAFTNVLPVLSILSSLINPALSAGAMFGCDSLAQGRGLALEHLFEGFRRRFGSLVLIGLLGGVAVALVVILVFVAMLGSSAVDMIVYQQPADPDPIAILLAALIAMALMIPIMMAMWFAPALVLLHEQPALKAMRLSLLGCLRNMWPFLLYGVGSLGLAVLATLPLFLGWLVFMPVVVASSYAAYRDIFID